MKRLVKGLEDAGDDEEEEEEGQERWNKDVEFDSES